MADNDLVRVSHLLDQRGLSPFQIRLVVWTLFIVLADGYDIGAIAFAAPHLVAQWKIGRAALGPVFSAGLIGILFGSGLFGWVGDRWGRRIAIGVSLLWFGVATLAAAWATDINQMFWLRFLAGLGIGGVIPNAVSINVESAPTRLRGTLAIIAVGFVPLGGAIPGVVATTLVPHYGWQALFVVGGAAPILIGLAALVGMPESIKFMALHERCRAELVRSMQAMGVGPFSASARFVIEDERQAPSWNPANLFRDGLALLTPLLWLLFALNLMGYYLIASWTPTVLTAAHFPPSMAAGSAALFQVGGTVGSLALARFFDRRHFLAVTLTLIVTVPVTALIGYVGVASLAGLLVISFIAGFCVLGVQTGINVIGALVYPTSLRASGSGWELGVGRFGSIVGPLFGALLVGLPVQKLYLWSAAPFAAEAVVCYVIYRLYSARTRDVVTATQATVGVG